MSENKWGSFYKRGPEPPVSSRVWHLVEANIRSFSSKDVFIRLPASSQQPHAPRVRGPTLLSPPPPRHSPSGAASPGSCPGWCQCLPRVLRVTVSANGSFSPGVDAKFLALWVIVACYHLQPHPRPELCGVNRGAEWRVNIYTWAPCRNNNGGRGVIGRQTSGSWLTLLQSADKLSKYIHHHHPPPRWLTIFSTNILF